MIKKLKDLGIMAALLLCSYATRIVSVVISGICTGRNEGQMAVHSCIVPGPMRETRANNGYGFLFLGLILLFVPLVLWLAGLIGGGFYRKRYLKKKNEPRRIGKVGVGITLLNIIAIVAAIITHIVISLG